MAKWDKEYLKLCKKILTEGVEVENRTGINTIKIPKYTLDFDLQEEFPILTTKQLYFKNAITEMLWMYQVASNDVRWLKERNNHVWDEWEIDEDGIYRTYMPKKPNEEYVYDPDKEVVVKDVDGKDMLDESGNVMLTKGIIQGKTIRSAKYFGKEWAHTIGTGYGWFINEGDIFRALLYSIEYTPEDRRRVISFWQNAYIKTAVLPACVWSNEWDITGDKLNLMVHQRSCDVPLGLPFNVTQYATLLSLVAHVTGYKPGYINWSIKDAHIYVDQVDLIKEQIRRGEELEDIEAPTLWINPEIKDFYDFDNSKELKDIKILNYRHHGKLDIPRAQ